LLEKHRLDRRREAAAAGTELKCPRCGVKLVERAHDGITTDACPSCGGVWMDKGEIDHLVTREDEGQFGRWLREVLHR
jgi:Zn-finger nucleic acid-binding protein